jgi:hypothetical protein
VPAVWDDAFDTFGIDSGSNLGSFAWGFPTWLLSGQFPSIQGYAQPQTVITLGPGDTGVPTPPPPVADDPESEEICYLAPGGDIACFVRGSIFAPGQVWGPSASEYTPLPTGAPAPADYEIIDPDFEPTARVFEPPTAQVAPEDTEMAVDWGDFLNTAAQGYIGGLLAPSPSTFVGGGAALPPPNVVASAPGGGGCPPRKTRNVTIDCATGQEVKRTRRRRRRLLTAGDLGDLAQLQALVGKGSNAMGVAVSKAIR